jgi:4-amino-4-deoxy-L-arabinose transferase-like glycosyltransferase
MARRPPASVGPWLSSAPRVLGLLAVWLLCTAWMRPLLLPDEGRYAEVAREMLAGDGWVPLLNGLPFFHKPPLTYWVDMLGMRLFGVTPFAVRLGPALGAWLMGAALWLWLRRQQGPAAAGMGLLVLATSPFWLIGGQYANHDMLVAGTLTVAVLCLARALQNRLSGVARPQALRWLLAGWAACGLAVLSKGLIGLVLPALVIGPWLLVQRRWRDVLWLLHPLGLVVFAAVALPWMLLMQQRYAGFFDYFIIEQHFRRYATSGFNNQQGPWFYFAVLPFLTLPWALWAPAALRRLRPGGGTSVCADTWLMAWWVLAVLGFFTLPASKLVGYAMPALAPWCALLAAALVHSRWWRGLAATGVVLCLATVFALASQAPHSNQDIGLALRDQVAAGDVVVMVDAPFQDVAFYARLPSPALVASDWADRGIALHDNWRKELTDAARFDPGRAAQVLWPIGRLPVLVCGGHRVWLVAGPSEQAVVATVPGAVRVLHGRHAQLWRADPRSCPGGG